MTGQRGQVLQPLDGRHRFFYGPRVSFQIGVPLTPSWPGTYPSHLSSATHVPDALFCVLETILPYLHDPQCWGSRSSPFFLATKPLISVASRNTLRCWTEFMGAAGINSSPFLPHSSGPVSSGRAALQLPLYLFDHCGLVRDFPFCRTFQIFLSCVWAVCPCSLVIIFFCCSAPYTPCWRLF